MAMNPAQAAQELQQFPFFKTFSEDLLLQLSAMSELKVFEKGSDILREGDSNRSLYFLRSGKVQVRLAQEVVAILQNPGEVMGEMSVVGDGYVSTTLHVIEKAECFVLDTSQFEKVAESDKDRFQSLLYRIYSVILSERLKKTNEKARLFEINHREMQESREQSHQGAQGRVVMVESEKKMQVIAKLALGGTGVDLQIFNDAAQAEQAMSAHKADLLICEDSNIDFLKSAHDQQLAHKYLLLTGAGISAHLDKLASLPFVDNVITRNLEDRAASSKALLTSINKVINRDFFGIEKYLSWGVEVSQAVVSRSKQRDEIKEKMLEHFRGFGVRNSILDRVNTVVEEMLMNAIYDAPVDSQGKSLFNHLSRKEEILLDSHQQSYLRYACDGIQLAVAVEDNFGALTKEIIINYLKSCYDGKAGSLNTHKGGAGRGLHQIVENSDLAVFNVKKGVRTEVICIFNLDNGKAEALPSLHYFFS